MKTRLDAEHQQGSVGQRDITDTTYADRTDKPDNNRLDRPFLVTKEHGRRRSG